MSAEGTSARESRVLRAKGCALIGCWVLFLLCVAFVGTCTVIHERLDSYPRQHNVLEGRFEGEWAFAGQIDFDGEQILESEDAPEGVPSRLRFAVDTWLGRYEPGETHYQLNLEDWARGTLWIDGHPSPFLLQTYWDSSLMELDGDRTIRVYVTGFPWVRLQVDWTAHDDDTTLYLYRRPRS